MGKMAKYGRLPGFYSMNDNNGEGVKNLKTLMT